MTINIGLPRARSANWHYEHIQSNIMMVIMTIIASYYTV